MFIEHCLEIADPLSSYLTYFGTLFRAKDILAYNTKG